MSALASWSERRSRPEFSSSVRPGAPLGTSAGHTRRVFPVFMVLAGSSGYRFHSLGLQPSQHHALARAPPRPTPRPTPTMRTPPLHGHASSSGSSRQCPRRRTTASAVAMTQLLSTGRNARHGGDAHAHGDMQIDQATIPLRAPSLYPFMDGSSLRRVASHSHRTAPPRMHHLGLAFASRFVGFGNLVRLYRHQLAGDAPLTAASCPRTGEGWVCLSWGCNVPQAGTSTFVVFSNH